MRTSGGGDAVDELERPEVRIGESVVPDEWNNIPVCLVKGFNTTIEWTEYLD